MPSKDEKCETLGFEHFSFHIAEKVDNSCRAASQPISNNKGQKRGGTGAEKETTPGTQSDTNYKAKISRLLMLLNLLAMQIRKRVNPALDKTGESNKDNM